jgi:hypothetical protein
MKKYIYYSVLILIIFGLCYFLKKQIAERKRLQSNYDVLALNKDNAERLYKNEVKLYYYSIDSLRKALNVRGKTVQTIFKTVVSFLDSVNFKDSTITTIDTIPYLTTDRVIKQPCYDLYLYENHEILNYHDVFTGFLHWDRPHRFLFIRWGAKEYYLKLYSDCQKDTIKVDKLIMIE